MVVSTKESLHQKPVSSWGFYVRMSTMKPKSLERRPAVGDFYKTGIEIWAGFGPVRQLLRLVFSCFHGQKNFFLNILDSENIFGIE